MADDRVLVMERVFNASPEDVFDAFTDPAQVVQWWGPEGMSVPESSFDVRVGGVWATTMRSREGTEHHVSGVYRALDRPHRVAFTWAWRQEDGSRGHETLVDIAIAAVSAGSKLTLTQKTFATAEHRDNHVHGWALSFNDLERFLGRA